MHLHTGPPYLRLISCGCKSAPSVAALTHLIWFCPPWAHLGLRCFLGFSLFPLLELVQCLQEIVVRRVPRLAGLCVPLHGRGGHGARPLFCIQRRDPAFWLRRAPCCVFLFLGALRLYLDRRALGGIPPDVMAAMSCRTCWCPLSTKTITPATSLRILSICSMGLSLSLSHLLACLLGVWGWGGSPSPARRRYALVLCRLVGVKLDTQHRRNHG